MLFFANPVLFAADVIPQEWGRQVEAARLYAQWARGELAGGGAGQERLLAFLERAQDYADCSSDLSYMLALAREALGKSARSVALAAGRAVAAERWEFWNAEDGLFLRAKMEARLRLYDDALRSLSLCAENEERALLRLSVLLQASRTDGRYLAEFRRRLDAALARYPFEAGIARIAFKWASAAAEDTAGAGDTAGAEDSADAVVEVLLKRLPALEERDGDLAFIAAPFLANVEASRALLAGYYARNNGVVPSAALPALLHFGVVDEDAALAALFGGDVLDVADVRRVWGLLRTDAAREGFRRLTAAFSGELTGDFDGDGYIEARARFLDGLPVSFSLDDSQDNDADGLVVLLFEAGVPVRARAPFRGEGEGAAGEFTVRYRQYPEVAEVAAPAGVVFRFPPGGFFFKPVVFGELGGAFGLAVPLPASRASRLLSERVLWANASEVERTGENFAGSVVRLQLAAGSVTGAREFLDGVLVCEDFYAGGSLRERRIDMDLDGVLETRLFFPPPAPPR
ncbi:MAG: hypothetical protein LBC72_04870 [Spirochaetaceae bacterium]|nr:hypothetical protein [Spirochaetaceae bacterium]